MTECEASAGKRNDMQDSCQSLLDWGREHQARVHPALDLFGTGPYSERGGVARAAIAAGDELLYIPAALTIQGPLEAHRGVLGEFYNSVSKPMSNVLRLALTMIHELHIVGSSSFWWPYLDLLAKTVKLDLLFMWPAESLQLLEGTMPLLRLPVPLDGELVAAESLTDVFARDVLPVMVEGGHLWPQEVRDPQMFGQCLSWIMSRAFQGGLSFACDGSCLPSLEAGLGEKSTGPFMTPFVDQLNHSSHPDVRNAKLGFEDGAFVVRALRDIACGEEVVQCYGEHSDAELLRTYGFIEGDPRGNPNNNFLISKEDVLAACRQALESDLSTTRLSFLEHSNALQLAYRIPSSGVFPKELLTVVQALLMNEKEFAEFESCGVRVLDESFHVRDSLLGGKVAACAMLILARTRKRYGADDLVKHAEAMSASAAAEGRRRFALKVREGELHVLKAAQSYIITVLAPQTKARRAMPKKAKRKMASKSSALADTTPEAPHSGDSSIPRSPREFREEEDANSKNKAVKVQHGS